MQGGVNVGASGSIVDGWQGMRQFRRTGEHCWPVPLTKHSARANSRAAGQSRAMPTSMPQPVARSRSTGTPWRCRKRETTHARSTLCCGAIRGGAPTPVCDSIRICSRGWQRISAAYSSSSFLEGTVILSEPRWKIIWFVSIDRIFSSTAMPSIESATELAKLNSAAACLPRTLLPCSPLQLALAAVEENPRAAASRATNAASAVAALKNLQVVASLPSDTGSLLTSTPSTPSAPSSSRFNGAKTMASFYQMKDRPRSLCICALLRAGGRLSRRRPRSMVQMVRPVVPAVFLFALGLFRYDGVVRQSHA